MNFIINFFERPDLIKSDGTFWVSSFDEDNPMAGLFNRNKAYYFREMIKNKKRRWWNFWRRRWVRSGAIYEGGNMAGFESYKK